VVNTSLPTAVPELARHDSEALTVAPGDAAALAGAINRLLGDAALRARLGAAARARALEHYDLPLYAQRMERLIEECAAGRASEQVSR